jgi:phosphoribosylglycinamide formyltransferase-1
LQALVDTVQAGALPVDIRAVVSDKPNCYALARARAAGIATRALRPRSYADRAAFDRALFDEVAAFEPRLVALAGYMRVLDPAVVAAWEGRMINNHPSLLPRHPGLQTHAGVLAAGDAVHGASVHFVTTELDGGPVIAQAEMPVQSGDDVDALATRLLPLEHRLFVASVTLIAAGAIEMVGHRVCYRGRPLCAPLLLDAQAGLVMR